VICVKIYVHLWLPRDLADLKARIIVTVKNIDAPMLTRVWQELEYCIDVCHVTRGAHIEHLELSKKNFFSFPVAVNNSIKVDLLVSLFYKYFVITENIMKRPVSRWILIWMINVSDSCFREVKTHILCSVTFPRKDYF